MPDKPEPKPPSKVREAVMPYLPADEEWVSAGEFKTHCLRLIEQVERERGEVVVTRYGRPVARLVPYEAAPAPLLGHMAGSVSRYGDIVSPVDEAWEADA
jgi:prevent-host-death family protein